MAGKLIPRFTAAQAGERLQELNDWLRAGKPIAAQVSTELLGAAPNATGGEAPTPGDLRNWREEVAALMQQLDTRSRQDSAHSMMLGKAIANVIDPSPSDAAHDGAWSFLSLVLFPDLVHQRWAPVGGELLKDRWVGKQLGRDRNYLKSAWRRWDLFGPLMEGTNTLFGEDEFGNLLERSQLARNRPLILAAAQAVANYRGTTRMDFTRELMVRLTYQTGPLMLDLLSDTEISDLVDRTVREIDGSPRAKRAAEPTQNQTPTNTEARSDGLQAYGSVPPTTRAPSPPDLAISPPLHTELSAYESFGPVQVVTERPRPLK